MKRNVTMKFEKKKGTLVLTFLEVVKRLESSALVKENPPLDEVGKRLGELILSMSASRNSKDIVQLFQRPLLRLWYKEEDHHERHDVQTSVEAERAHVAKGFQHSRESERKDRSPE